MTEKNEGRANPNGINLQQRYIKRTRYVIKNNSLDREIPKFYIDHVADPTLGGYVVTTQKNCIKSVMGFSRFEFSIKPQEEIEFIVDEEAQHSKSIHDLTALESFVEKQVPDLITSKLIDEKTVETIQSIINQKYIQQVLRQMIDNTINDGHLRSWAIKRALIPATLYEKAIAIVETQATLQELDKKIKAHEAHIKGIFENQERIRQNIKSLEKIEKSVLMDRYLKDLNAEEDDLQETRRQIKMMQDKYSMQQRQSEEKQAALKHEAKEFQKKMQN